jgi:hypothetical protein
LQPAKNSIRQYVNLIDENFAQHKVVVSAHLTNLHNSFAVQQKNIAPNFFDLDKWCEK